MPSTPKTKEQKMPTGIVVIAEHADGHIKPVTYEIITFAKKLQHTTQSNPVKLLLLGDEVIDPAQELAEKSGLDVTRVQIPEMRSYNGELYLRVLTEYFSDKPPAFVCIAHTSQGLDYAPAEISDITESGIFEYLATLDEVREKQRRFLDVSAETTQVAIEQVCARPD